MCQMINIRLRICGLACLIACISAPQAYAQEEAEHLVVVGSRTAVRAAYDTNVPVDVISSEDIARTHVTETAKLIQTLVPSFNFSVSTVSDGTDAVRPATLRGLYPDQVLVLVNGKRRHTSALLHVNGSVGRGSVGVDLNAIPPSAIERIEVLRDGAAAQYGSDAVAGIINIVLKERVGETEAQAYYGETYQGDGEQRRYSFNGGFALAETGFFNLTAERRDRNPTNRAGEDIRCQYGGTAPDCNDPAREARFDRVSHRVGDAESDNDYVFFNSALPLRNGVELYAFGGISQRETEAGGFYRRASDRRNLPSVYADGFLPLITTDVDDDSLALGAKFDLGAWRADVSAHYGENTFDFRVKDSLNVSLGAASPRQADSGGLKFDQTVFKADATRPLEIADFALDIATGYEYRRDGYRIRAGDPASYIDGGQRAQDGERADPGIQVFPGFRPENEVDVSRHNHSLYLDGESWVSDNLSLAAAARWESYSDFGNDMNGKLSMRYEMSDVFALRGAVSSGFRAPSLAQQYFNNISTQFVRGVPREVLTANNASGFVRAIGGEALEEENSVSLSFGFVANPLPRLTVTADAYRAKIRDRIVLSRQFVKDDIRPGFVAGAADALMREHDVDIDAVRFQFFSNAMDTVTRGLDVIVDYDYPLDSGAAIDFTAALNFNTTRRDGDIENVAGLRDGTAPFTDIESYLEEGSPRQRYSFTTNYADGDNNWTWRLNHYGSVVSRVDTEPQHYGARWLADVEYTRSFGNEIDWTVGALNLFDTRPERNSDANRYGSAGGSFVYSRRVSPFGFNGGFYFTNLKYRF